MSGGRKWFGELKDSINKSFKKLRISKQRKDKALLQLFDQKVQLNKEIKSLKNMKICLNMKELQDKLLSVESRIANYSSARNVKILSSHIEDLSEKNGKFNITKMWKLRKKLCPKSLEKPSAKINEKGKLVTQKKELKELYKNTYISR